MLRILKILLVLSVALWGLIGAFGNLSDWSGTLDAVKAATSMSTFEGGADNWRATTNPVVILIGALFIMLSKTIAGLLCLMGAWRMWHARAADAVIFAKSKTLALAGCAVAIFMLFTGFIVIAESWFELWRSDALRGPVLDSAFRYGGMISLIALFVATRDD
jgi:predicted small integral membrane protein